MSVNTILSYAAFSRLTSSNDDLLADRISHLYTVLTLIIFAIIVGVKQFVGDPIQCWTPADFKPAQSAYVLSNCWIQSTYYVQMEDVVPSSKREREAAKLAYYQWVPIILLFMAFLFKLPYILWRMCCELSGFNVSNFVSLAYKTQYGLSTTHDENVKNISDYLDRWLAFNKKLVTIPSLGDEVQKPRYFLFESASRWYLMILYYFIKVLYCVNAVTQFFLLNQFLGGWYAMYGSEVIQNMIYGEPFMESHRFPLVTLCDYQIRQMNNVNDYTSMCVLSINLFSEKIFIFIWFWLVFVCVVSIISLIKWTLLIVINRKRLSFVHDYLLLLNILCGEQDKSHVKKFVLDYLKGDGMFILKILDANAGAMVTSDIVKQLWYIYRNRPSPITATTQF
ncbi:hypothetical protein LOTGIDRAFT_165688 [Lottia gigantea]|uniref:Innexin n=1 Tax=Lottia gigantea TaxID=225164 RepID=V3ZB67_LOTGI|nr:hypothetical protein LOTGIDRAFT_165688 [Lottia gigantea]ESO88253.1 hypothetical protein LOTGIDRAFT_165688 [Lottia gigantea]